MVEIKLCYWAVKEFLEEGLKRKYNIDADIDANGDGICVETEEAIHVYKKHKNGKVMKHEEYGYPIVDHDKTTYKKKYVTMWDGDSISFYVKGLDEDDEESS
jgi:hypothetical protein